MPTWSELSTKDQNREVLGMTVRAAWVTYCTETGDDKPSHLTPWRALSDWDKEADRRIGEAVLYRLSQRSLDGALIADVMTDVLRAQGAVCNLVNLALASETFESIFRVLAGYGFVVMAPDFKAAVLDIPRPTTATIEQRMADAAEDAMPQATLDAADFWTIRPGEDENFAANYPASTSLRNAPPVTDDQP